MKYACYAGIATVLILWSSISIGMLRSGLHFIDMRPLSYLGTDYRSDWLFSSGLILAAITTMIFGGYLVKKFNAVRWFLYVLFIGQASQVVAALVPYSKVSSTRLIHTIAALMIAITTPVFMY